MKRFATSLLIGLAVAGGTSAVVAPALAAGGTKVRIRHTSLGPILVNGRGFTLYVFTRDRRNRDKCHGISGCPAIWPLLTTNGRPMAGKGVKRSLLGTIKVGGSRQVTYAGHPLYRYSGDFGPGSTSYVGFHEFGGTWYAINAKGKVVK